MRKEGVKSILYPSEIIAVPYLNKAVVTTRGRVYCGRISPIVDPGRVAIVQPEGRRIAVPDAEGDRVTGVLASERDLEVVQVVDVRVVRREDDVAARDAGRDRRAALDEPDDDGAGLVEHLLARRHEDRAVPERQRHTVADRLETMQARHPEQ